MIGKLEESGIICLNRPPPLIFLRRTAAAGCSIDAMVLVSGWSSFLIWFDFFPNNVVHNDQSCSSLLPLLSPLAAAAAAATAAAAAAAATAAARRRRQQQKE